MIDTADGNGREWQVVIWEIRRLDRNKNWWALPLIYPYPHDEEGRHTESGNEKRNPKKSINIMQ